jgi:hypothetical protein
MLLGLTAGFGFLSAAQAVSTTVYITGSTAIRSHIFAIINAGAGGTFTGAPTFTGYQGSSAGGCTFMMWSGTAANAAISPLTIKAHWSGSEGGIGDLNGTPATETFLADVGSGAPVIVVGDQHGTTPVAGQLVSSAVGVAMADNSVVFSKAPNAPIDGNQLGIITFEWVKEKNSVGTFTDIKDTYIRTSLASGGVRLSQISGVEGDSTWVYVTGRDNNSGTRVNTYGVTGFGIFKHPNQVEVDATGAMLNTPPLGDGPAYGYSSGGGVATQMGNDLSLGTSVDRVTGHGGGHFSVIGYLGNADAVTAVANGGTLLTYNGVTFSQANIEGGQYTFWGNEFIYENSAEVGSGDANDTVLQNISTALGAEATDDGYIQPSVMHVSRTGPTTDPTHK